MKEKLLFALHPLQVLTPFYRIIVTNYVAPLECGKDGERRHLDSLDMFFPRVIFYYLALVIL